MVTEHVKTIKLTIQWRGEATVEPREDACVVTKNNTEKTNNKGEKIIIHRKLIAQISNHLVSCKHDISDGVNHVHLERFLSFHKYLQL